MISLKLREIVGGIVLAGLILVANENGFAQSSISGPRCVTPGITYQYLIGGKPSASALIRVCITGGHLTSGSACSSMGATQNMVLVIWDSSASSRKIALTSGSRTDSLVVMGTMDLRGGVVDDTDKVQSYSKVIGVYTFHCSQSIGGSCSPNYKYQWQSSDNGMNWRDIDGAVDKDLRFKGNISGSTYFRRITNELQSNSIAYSDWARLDIAYGIASN